MASAADLAWGKQNQTQKNCKLCQIDQRVYETLCTRGCPGSLARGLESGEGSRNSSTFQKTSRHPLQTTADVQSMYVPVTSTLLLQN